jgi:hypothetical protein
MSEAQRAEIEKANERASRQPLKSLGSKGDVFYLFQERYKILDRSPQFLLCEVQKLGMNPDGSVPLVANKQRKLIERPFWCIYAVHTHREIIRDGQENDTGLLTGPVEYIHQAQNLEIIETDARGWTVGVGFNGDKSRVEKKFLEVVKKHEDEMKQKADAKITEAEDNRLKEFAAAVKAEAIDRMDTLREQIKIMVQNRKFSDLEKDSLLQTLVSEYSRLDVMLKIKAL